MAKRLVALTRSHLLVSQIRPLSVTSTIHQQHIPNIRDHYRRLGIGPESSLDEIKRAYFDASKQCHPDLHPGDKVKEQRYIRINESYELIMKSKKENSKNIATGLKNDRGKMFGRGKFRPDRKAQMNMDGDDLVKKVKVKTPIGFGRGTAKKEFQTGTLQGSKDEYTQDVIKRFKR